MAVFVPHIVSLPSPGNAAQLLRTQVPLVQVNPLTQPQVVLQDVPPAGKPAADDAQQAAVAPLPV